MMPLVSVGVALYRHERYIGECLTSIAAQSWPRIELIVIDDGSDDASWDIAQRCLHGPDALPGIDRFERVVAYSRPNRGMCHTLNEIARQACGRYIGFIGSDDRWRPDKVAAQAQYLEAHPEVALVHSNALRIDAHGRPLREMNLSQRQNSGRLFEAIVQRTGGINTASCLYRRSVYDHIGYYDPTFSFEDTDFWLRLTDRFEVGYIDACHVDYRWHGENLSARRNALEFYYDELIAILHKNVADERLRRPAIARLARKAIARAIVGGSPRHAWRFLPALLGRSPRPNTAPHRTRRAAS